MDVHSQEQRKKNMQAIRSKGTKIEVLLGKALWELGYRYRKNTKTLIGKPDFTFKKYKIAIFCDSEFFHGKDWENQKQRIGTNREFWIKKIESNIKRDERVNQELSNLGWTVLRFWGKDILKNMSNCLLIIESAIDKAKNTSNI